MFKNFERRGGGREMYCARMVCGVGGGVVDDVAGGGEW